ncbi:low molecular weight protein arginine phosphatase [Tumebacillus sp. DT12]|uniref:Low molecular weight protein arginine phosphatase n=1 Tax=Tumebacillus lacus TaxID=2995335 RepID=A0ABT3X0N8_9BACL|nr:low molecular weight protein arginine phosphatase [Tumebacillus lacus]MCX7569562.1 low molecular weight protein arginine phosphatase [Tumebacillus lacus]
MNLLFVCTGNTCRSAMAEPMMRRRLEGAGLAGKWEVRSAGVAAYAGQSASQGAREALRTRGVDGESHQATLLDEELVKWADLILTMSQSHKRAILERHIEALDKTFTLKEFVDDDPEHERIFEEMAQIQAEAQTKQALFLAEHADEIESLQERYGLGADAQIEQELAALQQRLEESVTAEAERMNQLAQQLPSFDIADPYGGPAAVYESTAAEIEGLLDKLVERLKEETP